MSIGRSDANCQPSATVIVLADRRALLFPLCPLFTFVS